jgi:hypothetical protein
MVLPWQQRHWDTVPKEWTVRGFSSARSNLTDKIGAGQKPTSWCGIWTGIRLPSILRSSFVLRCRDMSHRFNVSSTRRPLEVHCRQGLAGRQRTFMRMCTECRLPTLLPVSLAGQRKEFRMVQLQLKERRRNEQVYYSIPYLSLTSFGNFSTHAFSCPGSGKTAPNSAVLSASQI